MSPSYLEYDQLLLKKAEEDPVSAFAFLLTLPEDFRRHGSRLILQRCSLRDIIPPLAEKYWTDPYDIAGVLDIAGLFPCTKKAVRTVGMYYTRAYNGGAERVVCLLSNILCKAGYRVVLITDEAPRQEDYYLEREVIRAVLSGSAPTDGSGSRERFSQFCRIMESYDIDAVIYHGWLFYQSFWDMCAIKSTGAAFIAHSHNVFIAQTVCMSDAVWKSHSIYRQADAIVTLSETDRLYWSLVNKRVFSVHNPPTFSVSDCAAPPLDGHRVLWLGRFDSSQKNPADVLDILYRLLPKVPDVQLTMAGDAPAELISRFKARADELGLSGHISFPGYSSEVSRLFYQADVLLQTSNFEGYSMVLGESLAFGVPVVCYEMPYATVLRQSEAVIQVPWKNFDAAADALADVLNQDRLRCRMGSAAQQEAAFLAQIDLEKCWTDIFHAVLSSDVAEESALSISREEFSVFSETAGIAFRQMHSKFWQARADCESALSQAEEKNREQARENSRLKAALEQSEQRCCELREESARLEALLEQSDLRSRELARENERLRTMLDQTLASRRYRLGSILLYLPAKLRFLLSKRPGKQ